MLRKNVNKIMLCTTNTMPKCGNHDYNILQQMFKLNDVIPCIMFLCHLCNFRHMIMTIIMIIITWLIFILKECKENEYVVLFSYLILCPIDKWNDLVCDMFFHHIIMNIFSILCR
jgi:hypothetical protein